MQKALPILLLKKLRQMYMAKKIVDQRDTLKQLLKEDHQILIYVLHLINMSMIGKVFAIQLRFHFSISCDIRTMKIIKLSIAVL